MQALNDTFLFNHLSHLKDRNVSFPPLWQTKNKKQQVAPSSRLYSCFSFSSRSVWMQHVLVFPLSDDWQCLCAFAFEA